MSSVPEIVALAVGAVLVSVFVALATAVVITPFVESLFDCLQPRGQSMPLLHPNESTVQSIDDSTETQADLANRREISQFLHDNYPHVIRKRHMRDAAAIVRNIHPPIDTKTLLPASTEQET